MPRLNHMRQSRRHLPAGFSLVELAIVLAVLGVISLGVVQFMPHIQHFFHQQTDEQVLDEAEQALKGFVLANHRLPCPDANQDGREDCTQNTGQLPYLDLGLSAPIWNAATQSLGYSVYQNAGSNSNLSTLSDRFQPQYPAAFTASSIAPSAITDIPQATDTFSNGLDFCWALKTAAQSGFSGGHTQIDGVNQAYVLVSPGSMDADQSGTMFDGRNALSSVEFESPNKPIDASYDDRVRAKGFAQLAGELNCAPLLAKVNAAVKASHVSYEALRLTQYYHDYRDFVLDVQEWNVGQAGFNMAMAVFDAYLVYAQNVIAIAGGAESFGVAVAALAIPAATSTALAVYGLVTAGLELDDAISALETANEQMTEAEENLEAVHTQYSNELNQAISLDGKGW
ncbi:MAG: type II secretion system protein [Hydrogenovibrio sp.]|uniref:type II secretion system protein n=1 Tax=Hydrogenovibrio sp. TaxID=2065821 RepID=UPI00287087CE|nr:type II secretion system protein [Hydrogenovibrio sp.]MDR9500113.1 type II secretion system protein [Hydrogenovibrio sp.]